MSMPENPEDIHKLFAEASSTGDLNALIALYEPDATVIAETGERIEGVESIRQYLEQFLTMRPTMAMKGSRIHRKGDLALLSSHWTARATAPDGSPVQMEFRGSELARQRPDGSWRLILDNPWGTE
jgi:uncharacterized protein (TIGR02246 family)